MKRLSVRWRAWRIARAQRRADREWLASGPSFAEVMRERNRRRLEWARQQVLKDDLFKDDL